MQANRSTCPINRGVEFLGDRWSLVIVRDMIFVGHRGFRELLSNSREGITPSTLSSRLKTLERTGLIHKADVARGHQGSYTLTEAGIQLTPLLFELAHIGSILDPLTDSTEARFNGWYGDHDKIEAYMEELRAREGLTTPAGRPRRRHHIADRAKEGQPMNTPRTLAADVLASLRAEADAEAQDAMRQQYGIHSNKMYGVPMRRLLEIARPLATNHELALTLWGQGSYEARTIAALVADPHQVSRDQMQRWCDDFDNWAIVDTTCFRLFDQTPHAWSMIDPWVADDKLFVRRAGFALLWALALHDRDSPDQSYQRALAHVKSKASDPRPLVGKAITMAMRAIAAKRPALHDEVLNVANDLVDDKDPVVRRVGRPIRRALTAM